MTTMMTILAIVIAVLLDRWTATATEGHILTRSRSVNWLNVYIVKMNGYISNLGLTQSYLVMLALFAPLCIILILAKLLFTLVFGAIGGVLFAAFVLFYFLGNDHAAKNKSEFVVAHERSFGILFWFALLGPIGSLLYWFLVATSQVKSADEQLDSGFYAALDWIHAIIAWVPVRITGFVYALVGNFTAGFNAWLHAMRLPRMPSSELLNNCGNASIDASIADDSQNLVYRAFIAWVILSVLIVVFK